MSGADQPRFVIRTTQGIHGPFSGSQIHGLVQQGQLKPNIRLFDQVTNAPVLVAQILRAIEDPAAPLPTGSGGEFPSVPQSAGPALAPDRTADDGSEIIPAEDLDLGDLDAEVAEVDIDPEEAAPAPPARGSGRRRPPSSRRSTLSEDRPPPPRRRSRYGSRDDYDRFDDDEDDYDDFDDDTPRPRKSPRKRRRMVLALMLSGFSLVIAAIVVVVLYFSPPQTYGRAVDLPGIWRIDYTKMLQEGQRPPEYGPAELRVTHDTITLPDGKQANYDVRIIKNGRAMSVDLSSEDGPQGQYEAHFEKRLVGEPTLWLQYPHKWIAFAPGPWPSDPRTALYEIRESVGAQRFDGLTGGVDAILQQGNSQGGGATSGP